MSTEKSRWAKLAGLPEPTDKQQLDENFVGIGMVGNIFDREKEKYEDAFEHFLSERYEEKVEEENPSNDKEVLFSLKNMKQAYDYGHYIGRTYKFNTGEKEKGFKDLLRSYDPPIVDATQEYLKEGENLTKRERGKEVGVAEYFYNQGYSAGDMLNPLIDELVKSKGVDGAKKHIAQFLDDPTYDMDSNNPFGI